MPQLMKVELLTERDDIFVIRNFFSKEDCANQIAKCEAAGFGEAPINAYGVPVIHKGMRNNERVMLDDVETANMLWERLKEFAPHKSLSCKPIGINERLRYYRYEPNQFFDWHFDGEFRRNEREVSRLTFMVYLNGDFTGGTTDFNFNVGVINDDDVVKVVPEEGMALVFTHNVLHRGAPVLTGKKYVLRSDVMYNR